MHFPQLEPIASLSQGVIFVTQTKRGWEVWLRYR